MTNKVVYNIMGPRTIVTTAHHDNRSHWPGDRDRHDIKLVLWTHWLMQLHFIRRQVPTAVFYWLVIAIVMPHLDYYDSALYGLPVSLIRRLQSVQNGASRLIFGIQRSEHITPAFVSLHWMCVSERISFKLSVLTYRLIHGAGPRYLQSCFTGVSDVPSRRRLRSSCSDRLHLPLVRLSTIDSRTFPASDATVWNDLPTSVTSAPSLAIFTQRLKTFLFSWHCHLTH